MTGRQETPRVNDIRRRKITSTEKTWGNNTEVK